MKEKIEAEALRKKQEFEEKDKRLNPLHGIDLNSVYKEKVKKLHSERVENMKIYTQYGWKRLEPHSKRVGFSCCGEECCYSCS
jgi:hypothetical protein